jgi:hypothetical protein
LEWGFIGTFGNPTKRTLLSNCKGIIYQRACFELYSKTIFAGPNRLCGNSTRFVMHRRMTWLYVRCGRCKLFNDGSS